MKWAAILLLFAASAAGQVTPGSSQVYNSANGTRWQAKAIVDVRDIAGIDCTGVTDSSTALNTLFTSLSAKKLVIPYNCKLRADSQLTIFGQTGWIIEGQGDRPFQSFATPLIFGCSGSAGPLIYINRTGYGRITGVSITPKGPVGICASSSFTESVEFDNTGGGGFTGQDFSLDNVTLSSNVAGTAVSGYVGFHVVGASNGEDMRLTNVHIHCQNAANSRGVFIDNPTSDNDIIEKSKIEGCAQGIRLNQGNIRIQNNLFGSVGIFSVHGSTGANVFINTCTSGPVNIINNEFDSAGPIINSNNDTSGGCSYGENIIGNVMGVSDISSTGYAVNLGTANARHLMMGNTVYITQAGITVAAVGSSSQTACANPPLGTFVDIGNTNFFPANTARWSGCAGGKEFSQGHIQIGTSSDGTAATNGGVFYIAGSIAGGTQLLDGAQPQLKLGKVGTAGQLGLLGSTSGTCTITVDATSTKITDSCNRTLINGGTIIGYSDNGSTQTWKLDSSTGALTATGVVQASSFIATSGGWTAGTIASIGDVICPSADSTASDCSHTTPVQNWIGIATGTSSTIYPQTSGFATLNYDATVSPVAGWYACVSSVTDGKVLVQAAVCPAGQRQVGIVAIGGTTVTSGSVWIKGQ